MRSILRSLGLALLLISSIPATLAPAATKTAKFNVTATVENDKYLDDLLAPRKSFNDRIEQDQQRN